MRNSSHAEEGHRLGRNATMKKIILAIAVIASLASCGANNHGHEVIDRYNGSTYMGRDTIARNGGFVKLAVGDTARIGCRNGNYVTVVKIANLN